MNTLDRIQLLAEVCTHPQCVELLGPITSDDLTSWVTTEFGRADALDSFGTYGSSPLKTRVYKTRACAPSTILHIVSGNTPHAAFQSLLRGLVLGSHNVIKLPSSGLPELTEWISSFPVELISMVETHSQLTDQQWLQADAVIAIGSDDAITSIQENIRPHQIFIPHGHKVSIGIIDGDLTSAAPLAARDTSLYNQRGCLSPHAFYVRSTESAREFAKSLADEMEAFAKENPPEPLSLSEAGAIRNLRETTRFAAANRDSTQSPQLWESKDNLDWTVIYDESATLKLSCLNRCIYVRPLPDDLSETSLGKESTYLSTVSLHPFSHTRAEALSSSLPAAHRICPLGQTQQPSLFWHHDGFAPLVSLVKWKDIG